MKYSISITIAVLLSASLFVSPALASTVVTTPQGTWTAYPGQATTYQAAVQQPINADGSSNFKANGKAVIPVKFGLAQGTGAFIFESFSDSDPATYAYSFLEFDPTTPPLLSEVTSLIADYEFTTGDCHVGSLRWTLYLQDGATIRNLDVHYQPGENGVSDQFCKPGTSGANMVDLSSTDPYVVINQFTYAGSSYAFSSSYNVTYSEAVGQLGELPVLGMNLILDSGYAGNQKVSLSSATVGLGVLIPTQQRLHHNRTHL